MPLSNYIPETAINANRSRGRFGDLSYPSEGATHGILMNFTEYSYSSGSIAGVTPTGSIALPMPASITDSYGINVSGKEIGAGGALLAEALTDSSSLGQNLMGVLNSAENTGSAAGERINELLTGSISSAVGGVTQSASTAAGYMNYLVRSGLSSLDTGFGDAMSAASGTAVNPHQTLVFDGVNLKDFSFQWSLAPKNETENRDIHSIIKTIKGKILPKYNGVGASSGSLSRGILTYPNMVQVSFFGLDPNSIFTFKRSMVTALNVDYSPNGNVMLKGAGGSAPAFVNISMSFTESEIWTAEDFE